VTFAEVRGWVQRISLHSIFVNIQTLLLKKKHKLRKEHKGPTLDSSWLSDSERKRMEMDWPGMHVSFLVETFCLCENIMSVRW
jgi:hypothetical protein